MVAGGHRGDIVPALYPTDYQIWPGGNKGVLKEIEASKLVFGDIKGGDSTPADIWMLRPEPLGIEEPGIPLDQRHEWHQCWAGVSRYSCKCAIVNCFSLMLLMFRSII